MDRILIVFIHRKPRAETLYFYVQLTSANFPIYSFGRS